VIDNLNAGKREYVNLKAQFVKADLLTDDLDEFFKQKDIVLHLTANFDLRSRARDTVATSVG